MKSYIKGVLMGNVHNIIPITASNPIQLDAIESEIIRFGKRTNTR